MLATLTGDLCLLVGLAVLLLPLLATELSRPRDGAWGAVVLLMGLVLATSSDRLRGAPMLAVACGALLISRLGVEVAQARWNQLSPEEQQRLSSRERWATSFQQLLATVMSLGSTVGSVAGNFKPSLPSAAAIQKREGASKTGKRWVRPESNTPAPAQEPEANPATSSSEPTSESRSESTSVSTVDPASAPAHDSPQLISAETDEQPSSTASTPEQAESVGPAKASNKGFGTAKGKAKGKGKRWVRPEPDAPSEPSDALELAPEPQDPSSSPAEGTGED